MPFPKSGSDQGDATPPHGDPHRDNVTEDEDDPQEDDS